MHVVAQLIGYPRIGPNRELKRALERMWSGRDVCAPPGNHQPVRFER